MKTTAIERAARKAERTAQIERSNARRAEIRAIVATGKCPDCGRGLKRNLSIAGWYQCSQLGAEQFRADPSLPSCNWQGFTE